MSAGPLASTERVRVEEISVQAEVELLHIEKWMTHERRARHEVAAKHQFYDDMGFDSAVLTMDWKTKFLFMMHSESMVDFFGKKGFCWGGIAVV
mmetsp:Transcript_48546/g.136425  ORF Transcript_48546/g.136425 Transcript_48546/m.136425 type:complete len:94 (+) Transcript_48546:369-650(+)